MPTRPGAFDEQAPGYDARAGLPASAGAAVAQAMFDWLAVYHVSLLRAVGAEQITIDGGAAHYAGVL